MRWLYHPLLLLIARSTDSQMAAQLEFLKAENLMLRRRLPKCVRPNQEEWELLLKLGTQIGNKAVSVLITIVSYSAWGRQIRKAKLRAGQPVEHRKQMGRPPTPEVLRELVIRLARENSSWGYTRILGELRKLGIKTSRSNVINILRGIAVDPKLDPTKGTWADFLRAHGSSLWQCDFFSKNVMRPDGLFDQCITMVFVHMLSRRVFVSPSTFYPTAAWKAQQASAFIAYAKSADLPAGIVFCDRDRKFRGDEFEGTLKGAGVKLHRLEFRALNTNAYVERFVQTIKHECLDKFIIYDPAQMDYLIREYVEHYHTERPHQSKGNMPLVAAPPTASAESAGEIVCRERLGGVLRHYYRAAA